MCVAVRALLVLALLALGACARHAELPDTGGDWNAHVRNVIAQQDWQLQGKIGVRAASGSGSAAIGWQQHGGNYRLVLSGALGMGRLVLSGDGDGVSWSDAKGRSGHHPDPDRLVQEAWGWRVPVSALRFWVRGIPDPEQPVGEQRIVAGMAESFSQAGWVIEPANYAPVDGLSLPTRVRLESDGVVLTVVVSRWEPLAP